MTFNPVTWNNTEPTANHLISNGQGTILNNFNFFTDATGNVFPGFLELPNGLIVQWGKTGLLAIGSGFYDFNSTTGASSINIQPFPTACFAIYFQGISGTPLGKVPICVGNGGTDLQKDKVKIFIATSSEYTAGAYVLAIGN